MVIVKIIFLRHTQPFDLGGGVELHFQCVKLKLLQVVANEKCSPAGLLAIATWQSEFGLDNHSITCVVAQ